MTPTASRHDSRQDRLELRHVRGERVILRYARRSALASARAPGWVRNDTIKRFGEQEGIGSWYAEGSPLGARPVPDAPNIGRHDGPAKAKRLDADEAEGLWRHRGDHNHCGPLHGVAQGAGRKMARQVDPVAVRVRLDSDRNLTIGDSRSSDHETCLLPHMRESLQQDTNSLGKHHPR